MMILMLILAIRVEWAKTFARVNRFKEEVELVLEEMRRVRRYFMWRRAWWKEREGSGCGGVLPKIMAGRVAYSRKQVTVIDQLDSKFIKIWSNQLKTLKLPINSINIESDLRTFV